MNNKQKGFTLIELLVVIAIIGILSSIVLASLNSARTKGQDASASAAISSMRAEAELSFDDNGDYASVCTDAAALITGAQNANNETVICNDSANTWSAYVPLAGDSASSFCAAYTGFAGKVGDSFAATADCGQ